MFRVLVLGALVLSGSLSQAAETVDLTVYNDGRIEYVEIRTASPFSLDGWMLVSVTGDQSYRFGDARLGVTGGRVISGATTPVAGDVVWTKRNVWNNAGDTALLLDDAGRIVAEHSYGKTSLKGASPLRATTVKGTRTRP